MRRQTKHHETNHTASSFSWQVFILASAENKYSGQLYGQMDQTDRNSLFQNENEPIQNAFKHCLVGRNKKSDTTRTPNCSARLMTTLENT